MKSLLFALAISLTAISYANDTTPSTPTAIKGEPPSVVVPSPSSGSKVFADIIEDLKEGNKRYMGGQSLHKNQDANTRQSLLKSQAPNTIVLSCSDSRVPVEIIFDKGIGEIFVVRNAGNIAENISIASIEYAIEHLGSKVLVVMGHDSCGAVKAALGLKKGKSAGSPNLDMLVKNIEGNLSYTKGVSRDLNNPTPAITANVRGVVASLMKRSKIIREYIERNKLMIVQAYYHFDSGEAEILEIGRPLLIGFEEKVEKAEEKVIEAEVPEYMKRAKKEEKVEERPADEKTH